MRSPFWCGLMAALFLAPAAQAQFDLLLVEGTSERAAPAVYDFGLLYANESASAHFRLRNTSGAAATLKALAVAGAGFTLTSPSLPVGLAPQEAIDLSVAFRAADTGAYSASLHSEGVAILLTATVAPRLTYRVDQGAEFPGALDFGNVVRGAFAERHIAFRNDTPGFLVVPAISVQGSDFRLGGPPPSGQAIAPGQGGEFTIVFTPQAMGVRQGSITLGDRNYPLLGTGVGPPLPVPTVSLDLKQAASAQQGAMIVRFDAPAQTSGTRHGDAGFPAVPPMRPSALPRAAAASHSRSRPAMYRLSCLFRRGPRPEFSPSLRELGEATDQQSVTIAGGPPGIITAQGVRSAGAVEIDITGFDNTRTLGTLSFTFYDAAGTAIAPGTLRTNAASDFASYFAGSDLGGVFLLRAVFPVTGDASSNRLLRGDTD